MMACCFKSKPPSDPVDTPPTPAPSGSPAAATSADAAASAAPPSFDFDVTPQSNVGPDLFSATEHADAQAAAAHRAQDGYDASGNPGGPFTEAKPPPGHVFGGYLKGCTGVVWTPVADSSWATDDGVALTLLEADRDQASRPHRGRPLVPLEPKGPAISSSGTKMPAPPGANAETRPSDTGVGEDKT